MNEKKEETKETATPRKTAGRKKTAQTVKLKVRKKYNDLEKNKIMEEGEELEVTVQRALILLDKGLVNLVS